MRRVQSVRHHARPSLALGADDLGMLREGNETDEDVLRKQLIDKDRENDRLQTQIQILQAQLAERPPRETIEELEKEYKNLDLLLQGTQRENERCMAELDRAKTREKMLERELARLAGDNWQSSLDIAPPISNRVLHHRSNTVSSQVSVNTSASHPSASSNSDREQRQAALAHVEQVRLLVLGMEQRLQKREEKLSRTVERAEHESRRYEQLSKDVVIEA